MVGGAGKTQGRCPRAQPHSALPNRASASPYSQVLARNGILLGGKESGEPIVTFPQFKPVVLPCGLKIPSVMECWLSLVVYYNIIICVGCCGLYVNGRVNATICVHWRPESDIGCLPLPFGSSLFETGLPLDLRLTVSVRLAGWHT